MLVIRLQRVGKKKQAAFRVVLQEHTWKPQGKTQELLGFYNPRTKERMFQAERVKYWISRGAKVSPTVHNLLVDEKIIEGPKIKAWRPKRLKDTPESTGTPESKTNINESGAKVVGIGTNVAAEQTPKVAETETAAQPASDNPPVENTELNTELTPKPEAGSETPSPSESVASAATGSSTTGEPEKEPAKTEA